MPAWARSCSAAGRVVREARSITRRRTTDERFLQLAGLRFEWMIAGPTVRPCRPHLFARPNLPTREHEVIGILCAHHDPTKTHGHLLLLPPARNRRLADRAVGRRVGWPFPRWLHSCQSTPTVGRPNVRRHRPRTTPPKIRSERPPIAGREALILGSRSGQSVHMTSPAAQPQPPSRADLIGGAFLYVIGVAALLLALTGLPLGYSLAESQDVGPLLGAMPALTSVGVGMIAFGRSVRSGHRP